MLVATIQAVLRLLRGAPGCRAPGSALHVMLFLENLIRALLRCNGLRSRHCQRALLVYHYRHQRMSPDAPTPACTRLAPHCRAWPSVRHIGGDSDMLARRGEQGTFISIRLSPAHGESQGGQPYLHSREQLLHTRFQAGRRPGDCVCSHLSHPIGGSEPCRRAQTDFSNATVLR